MRRRRWLLVPCLALAGCGGGSGGEDALRDAAAKLSEVRSGELTLRFEVSAEGSGRDADTGFAIEGPFALAERRGALPRIELTSTQIAGPRRTAATVVANGRRAWVRTGGQTYLLPAERTRRLRGRGGRSDAVGDLDALDIADWIAAPERADGPRVGRVATERITGRLRTAAALNDLFALGRRVGAQNAGSPAIGGAAARRLDDAKRDARITVDAGREDGLVRRIRLHVAFPLERSRDLGGDLGRLTGARVGFSMTLRRPNRPVRIDTP